MSMKIFSDDELWGRLDAEEETYDCDF
jgi:hypothetical protein